MKKSLLFLLCVMAMSLTNLKNSYAQDEFEKVEVLDYPRFSLTNRVTADMDFTFLPLDGYYKPLLIEAAGSYQFNDWFTWEVLRAGFSIYEHDTKLADSIITQTGFTPNPDDLRLSDMQFRLSSTPMINLLYSKSNWFNEAIVYHYWQAGLGLSYYNMDEKSQIGIDFVLRARFFINEHFMVNIRGGHTVGFKDKVPANIAFLGVGTGVAF